MCYNTLLRYVTFQCFRPLDCLTPDAPCANAQASVVEADPRQLDDSSLQPLPCSVQESIDEAVAKNLSG